MPTTVNFVLVALFMWDILLISESLYNFFCYLRLHFNRYIWEKDNSELEIGGNVKIAEESEGSLVIEKADTSNAGYYQCLAKNPWGADMSLGITLVEAS